MAEHIDLSVHPVALNITVNHRFDDAQLAAFLRALDALSSPEDLSQITDLTAKLKASGDALAAAEAAAGQPQPPTT